MTYRILHFIPGLGHGGAEHQLLLNLSLIDRARFENIVCHMYPRTALAQDIEAVGAQVISLETRGLLKTPRMVNRLRRVIRERGIDLVHATNAEAGIVGGLAGKLTGVPVVTTLNGSAYDESWLLDNPRLNRLKLRYMKASRRASLRFLSDHSIAVSQHVKDEFHRSLGVPCSKMDVVQRGVSDDFFETDKAQVERVRAELLPDAPFPALLNVGRLVPAKGHRYLVAAMPRILETYPRARLLIVGTGFLSSDLQRMVQELGLEPHVTFTGPRRDVRAMLEAADVFVFPSLHEGCPGALIEAMTAGRACVATDSGPMPELIEHGITGLLVKPQSPGAIADAVLRLVSDIGFREEMGAAARRRAVANFRAETSVRVTEKIFEKVIARDRQRRSFTMEDTVPDLRGASASVSEPPGSDHEHRRD